MLLLFGEDALPVDSSSISSIIFASTPFSYLTGGAPHDGATIEFNCDLIDCKSFALSTVFSIEFSLLVLPDDFLPPNLLP